MSKQMKTIVLAAAVLAVSAASASAANTYGFVKANQNQFVGPVALKMHQVNGAWRLKDERVNLPIQYEAGVKGLNHLDSLGVYVGNGPWMPGTLVYPVRRGLERKSKVWGTSSVPVTREQLAAVEAYGATRCIPGRTISTGIPITMRVGYKPNIGSGSGGHFARHAGIPANFVCEESQHRPAQIVLRDMRLSVHPARPVCGQPVALVAEFRTSFPGKVDFILTRDNGMQQRDSVTTRPQGNETVGRWSKTYTINQSETRKYMIIAQGHPLSTNWVEMKLECGAGASAGGPSGQSGAAPSSGSAPKPSTAPQRSTRHLGKGVPRAQ